MTRTASGVRRHLCQDCWPLKPGAVSSQRLRRSQSQGARAAFGITINVGFIQQKSPSGQLGGHPIE